MAEVQIPPIIYAPLNHLSRSPLWEEEKPYEIWMDKLPLGAERSNVTFEVIEKIPLTDTRSLGAEGPSLDREGFEIFKHRFPEECKIDNVDDVDRPEKRQAVMDYLNIMTKVLVDRFNGNRAICYDWRVRRSKADSYETTPRIYFVDLPEEAEVREHKIDVSHNVHGDGSPDGIKKQLSYLLTEKEQLELATGQRRLQVVNLWRPVVGVVETEPLALCDIRTVIASDWEPVEKIFENWIEESMYLKHNDSHRWLWTSKQTRDEVTAFCVWDSKRPDEPHASAPHSSFLLPTAYRGPTPREKFAKDMINDALGKMFPLLLMIMLSLFAIKIV